MVILSEKAFRKVTSAVITDEALAELERCNKDNIAVMEEIVGVDVKGAPLADKRRLQTTRELRHKGRRWSVGMRNRLL